MKINIFKKIITSASLIIFLFGLFVPFSQIFAQDANNQLRIVVDKMKAPEDTSIITLTSGEDVFITAKTYQLTNKLISFEASPVGGAIFSPQQCTTDGNSFSNINSCQVGFKAISEGTFKIKASTNFNGKLYSNEIDIIVTATGVELKNCPSGQILVNNICTTLKSTTTPTTDTTYNPLAPLPDGQGGTLTTLETDKTKSKCPFGNYLNIIIKLVIGFAAVLAMVMIVMGGIEYMTDELVSGKEAGKERIIHAVLGLLLALGSYLILNTINPQLLNACLDKLPQAEITIINDFQLSGGLTFNGQPIKVNFNTQAYPAAKVASQKTGIDTAFILAIFAQETSSGVNTGGCVWNSPNANMDPKEVAALKEIVSNWETVNVSCSGGASAHGGAIGYTQFLPSTWKQYRDTAAGLLGHQPSAWNVDDALMMTAVYLKNIGGINNQKEAACQYFSGKSCSTSAGINSYGDSVMGKKLSIQQQITDAISKGTLTP